MPKPNKNITVMVKDDEKDFLIKLSNKITELNNVGAGLNSVGLMKIIDERLIDLNKPVEAYSQMKNITDNHPNITKTMLYWRWKDKYPVDFEGWKIHKVKVNKAFEE